MNNKRKWSLVAIIFVFIAVIAGLVWPKGKKSDSVESKEATDC